jgi:hypothetical protein
MWIDKGVNSNAMLMANNTLRTRIPVILASTSFSVHTKILVVGIIDITLGAAIQ